MDHNARIQAAIDDLKTQKRVNFAVTARRWDIERTTLTRRFRGTQGIIKDANSYVQQQLTQNQLEVIRSWNWIIIIHTIKILPTEQRMILIVQLKNFLQLILCSPTIIKTHIHQTALHLITEFKAIK